MESSQKYLTIATTFALIAQLYSHYRLRDSTLSKEQKESWKNYRAFFSVVFLVLMGYLIYLQSQKKPDPKQ